MPLSFRLTSDSGEQVTADSALTSIHGGATVDTRVHFNRTGHHNHTAAPTHQPSVAPVAPSSAPATEAPATEAPTSAATHAPTSAATRRPTEAPTEAPTRKPTEAPTEAPTSAPTEAPTRRPTETPTSAPTEAPTSAPTEDPDHSRPTPATAAPTQRATHAPTAAPTQRATQAPTQRATQAPHTTTAPTEKPATSAPTQRPATQAPTAGATSGATSGATPAPSSTKAATQAPSTSGSSTSLCGVTSTSSEPLKFLIPLYVEPGSAWTELITAASTGVQIIAIINPNSGPDTSGPDSSYTSFMSQFAAAGITMVGYVHTSFGDRSISDVTTDINTYASLYTGLAGIFIDEASDASSEISYYTQVYDAITSHSGYTNVILNPGTQPDQGYVAISSSIVIFEDSGSNFQSNFASWVTCAPTAAEKSGYKYHFAGIAHDVASGSVSSTLSEFETAGMGLVYVTDGAAGCCTYNTLASYFTTEASDVQALN
jgi:hypothetical protein